jgi:hypothetical protein
MNATTRSMSHRFLAAPMYCVRSNAPSTAEKKHHIILCGDTEWRLACACTHRMNIMGAPMLARIVDIPRFPSNVFIPVPTVQRPSVDAGGRAGQAGRRLQ